MIPRVWLRADAGFPAPEFLDALEKEDFPYVCRLRSNAVLERMARPRIDDALSRPAGEHQWVHEFSYQAGTWERPRRVVLVIVENPGDQGGLSIPSSSSPTSRPRSKAAKPCWSATAGAALPRAISAPSSPPWPPTLSSTPREKSHYRGREIAGDYLEPDAFAANEAKLLLSLLAANLLATGADLLSRGEPSRMSRDRFRTLLLKSAARVLLSGRRVSVVIATSRAALWLRVRAALQECHPARGSPLPYAPA